MIELLFSIVILSIVLLSLPMIFRQVSQNTVEALKVEAVNEMLTVHNGVLTYFWDENTPNEHNTTFYILDVKDGDDELGRATPSSVYRRAGFAGNTRRHFDDTPRYASDTLGPESGENGVKQFDDSDDFNGYSFTLTKGAQDYVLTMDVRIAVKYVDDGKDSGIDYSQNAIRFDFPLTQNSQSTNIKMIEVKIVNHDTGETILLGRNYICNLGGVKINYRSF